MFETSAFPLMLNKENDMEENAKPLDLAKKKCFEKCSKGNSIKTESPKKSIFTSVEMLAKSSVSQEIVDKQQTETSVVKKKKFEISSSFKSEISTIELDRDFNNNDIHVPNLNSSSVRYVTKSQANKITLPSPVSHSPSLLDLVKSPPFYQQKNLFQNQLQSMSLQTKAVFQEPQKQNYCDSFNRPAILETSMNETNKSVLQGESYTTCFIYR